jgi:hypothetical protein
MLTSTQHQSWFFYLPLAKQAALLKDDLLEPVDQLLDDPLLVGSDALSAGAPRSRAATGQAIADQIQVAAQFAVQRAEAPTLQVLEDAAALSPLHPL